MPGSPPARNAAEGETNTSLDANLVRIRSFSGLSGQLTAGLARNLLQASGIPSVVAGETGLSTNISLLVLECDVNRATEILKSFLDSPGPIPVE